MRVIACFLGVVLLYLLSRRDVRKFLRKRAHVFRETLKDYLLAPPRKHMCIRYNDMADDADMVIVFCGNNDFTQSVPLGTPESCDTATFYGALNTLLHGLREKYPTSIIMIVTPLRMKNYSHPLWREPVEYTSRNVVGCTLQDYRDAIVCRCSAFHVPICDIFAEEAFSCSRASSRTLTLDGLHPNDCGHRLLADKIATSLGLLHDSA